MNMPVVTLAGEGFVDLAILRRLARAANLKPGPEYGRQGKDHLDLRIAGYNKAARFGPWAVVRDMDDDASCAGALAIAVLPSPEKLMCFRIVIRSAEAWLLGDAEAFCEKFSVRAADVPKWPESDPVPKVTMLNALARSSSREIRDAMVRDRSLLTIGPEYNARLSAFAEAEWRPSKAAGVTKSLARAQARLRELHARCLR